MLWLMFATLFVLGAVGLLGPYTSVPGLGQILLISALMTLEIERISAVSTHMRRLPMDYDGFKKRG